MNTEIERRNDPRMPVDWPVELMTSEGTFEGKTCNISISGALFLLSETPEIEDKFHITLKSSLDHKVSVTCEKMRSDTFIADESFFNEIAVRFLEISSNDRKIIASMVEDYFQNFNFKEPFFL
jgi:hypothetical protein